MSSSTSAQAAALAAGVLCGTAGIAVALVGPSASAPTLGSARLLVGGTVLVLAARRRGGLTAALAGHWRGVVGGGVAVALYQMGFFAAVERAGVTVATVVAIASAPVVAGLIDAWARRAMPSAVWFVTTATAVAGVVLLGGGASSRLDLLGVGAALMAGACWATYAAVSRRRIECGLDPTTTMAAMFATGAVLASPMLLLGDHRWLATGGGMALAGYLGLVTIAAAYTLVGRALRSLPSPTVVTLMLSEPVAAALLATVVLREPLSARGAAGVGLVVAGIALTARTGQPVTGHRMGCEPGWGSDRVAV